MRALVATVILSGLLVGSILSAPVLGQENASNATVTITMTGLDEISITLDKTTWYLGAVASGTEYETDPPIEWCTLTVGGTCCVNTFIAGDDAKWVDNPGAYRWTLSNDGSNGEHTYGLWFRISHDATRGPNGDGYVPITRTVSEFWPYSGGSGSSLCPGSSKQFGLKLLTPTYFYSGRQMETQVTLSAVAAR
ncbi:MAG: hypothetical protein ACUVTR_07355 [Dehalococcoidia bacterium]